MLRRLLTFGVFALALLPAVAFACPNCVGGADRLSTTLKLVALFMAVPFALCAGVVWAIRRTQVAPSPRSPLSIPPPPTSSHDREGATVASDGSSTAAL